MTPLRAFVFACAAASRRPSSLCARRRAARARNALSDQGKPAAPPSSLTEKTNAYVGCINRQSARARTTRAARYFSWVSKNGPTGKERIIYGLYTIYDTSDCRKDVEKANALEPRDAELEAAAAAYAAAVSALEPLLQEAYDYYNQEDYKDDKMAKGRALHPRLIAAWNAFESADKALRTGVETINDRRALERLAAIESRRGPQGALPLRGADDPGEAPLPRDRPGQARRRGDHGRARRIRGDREGAGRACRRSQDRIRSSSPPARPTSPRRSR